MIQQQQQQQQPFFYPQRLLFPTQQQQHQQASESKRRVRPIALEPPPGLEKSQPSSTQSSSYSQYVKMRAIAGCLDGDWSSTQPLPDIPSILLSGLVQHLSFKGVLQPQQQEWDWWLESSGLGLNSTGDLGLNSTTTTNGRSTSSGLSSTSIATTTTGHSSSHSSKNSSWVKKAAHLAVAPHSPFRKGFTGNLLNNQHHQHQHSRLFSRQHQQPSYSAKRRLAPTQLTCQSILDPSADKANNNSNGLVKKAVGSGVSGKDSSFSKGVGSGKSFASAAAARNNEKSLSADASKNENILASGPSVASSTNTNNSVQSSSSTQPSTSINNQSSISNQSTETSNSVKTSSHQDICLESVRPKIAPPEKASNEHRLQQRQKQIDIGKNTPEYQLYLAKVPKNKRQRHLHQHPVTPDKSQDISKRNWEGQVRAWRRRLHEWDTSSAADQPESDGKSSSAVNNQNDSNSISKNENDSNVDTSKSITAVLDQDSSPTDSSSNVGLAVKNNGVSQAKNDKLDAIKLQVEE